MIDPEFISDFISLCSQQKKPPIAAAKQEISEIDIQLAAAENLKVRRMNLLGVLDHLGDESHKRKRASAIPSSDDIDISSDEIVELLKKIYTIVGEEKSIFVKDLIRKVGGYDQDALIMRSVKFLGEKDILSRTSDGKIVCGKRFDFGKIGEKEI
jgi:hypothetical protein